MTNNLNFIADMATLAEASYANLTKDLRTALTENDSNFLGEEHFSATQAADFIQKWSVVPGSYQPDMASGFSATLFQGLSDAGDLAGQYVLAIRGTQGFTDLFADGGDIVLDGLAVDQIIDLYNYTQRLTHTGTYQAAILIPVLGVPLPKEYAQANGLLYLKGINDGLGPSVYRVDFVNRNDGLGILPSGAEVQVTGHSLGGHLAAAFSRLFPALTLDATMINGAGFSTGDPLLASSFNVTNLFQMLGGANNFDASKIINYIGTAGWDFVSQDWFIALQQPGGVQSISTETFHGSNTVGHGAGQMTNALAIMSLFTQLDQSNTIDIDTLNRIFAAAANKDVETFESLVNDLARLFGVTEIANLDADSTTVGREALYKSIHDIQVAMNGLPPTSVVSLVGKSAAELKVKAEGLVEPENALAYRYALVNLNPFAIVDYTDTLYTSHNQNGELNLYDPNATTNPGALTEQYLTDRAAMLAAVIQANTNDAGAVIVNSGDSFTYQDVERNLTLDVLNTANFGGLLPPLQYKVIFGDNNDDTLTGTNGNDRIYAGGGNDTLNGGAGGDYLEGGRGDDAYVGLNEHDTVLDVQGNDSYQLTGNADATITDVDGIGDIAWDGTPVTGGSLQSGDTNADGAVWQSADGVFTYTRSGADLFISKSGDAGYATLKHFNFIDAASGLGSNDTLGISFSGAAARSGHALTSDSDTYDTAPGETAVLGLDGNDIITVTTPYVPGASVFGGDGNDSLYVEDAQDYSAALLQGGTAALPDPTARGVDLFGEGGNDFIEGSLKADTLNGGDGVNWLSGLFGDDTLIGGPRTDLLHGNADTDLLIGGGGGDQLFGGAQTDTLVGGPGNDVLWGDAESVGQQFQPDAIDETATGWRDGNYNRNLGAIPLPAIGGVDIVIAEAHGNAAGDDVLDGGAGEDQLYREAV